MFSQVTVYDVFLIGYNQFTFVSIDPLAGHGPCALPVALSGPWTLAVVWFCSCPLYIPLYVMQFMRPSISGGIDLNIFSILFLVCL